MLLTLIFLVILLLLIQLKRKQQYDFWKRHGISQLKPHWICGNLYEILTLKKSVADHFKDLYNHPDAVNHSIVGIYVFNKPALIIRDPELIKRILVKDFTKFPNRYATTDFHGDPIGSRNLFFIKNPAWRELRPKFSTFFTSGKLRQIFPIIDEIGKNLNAYLSSLQVDNESQSVCMELKEVCSLYTTDVIASIAFGIQANSFHNPNGEFRQNGREMFRFTVWRALGFISIFFLPKWVSFFKFKVLPKETCDFLRSAINYAMDKRKKSDHKRNDLIDIFIDLEKLVKCDSRLKSITINKDVFVAQAALFFTAGFDSSSSTMSFALYELSKRKDLQARLRHEIRQGFEKTNGHVTYEMIDSLEFLHAVVLEVMRLYPLVPFLDRECTLKEGEKYSLLPFSNFQINRGMPIYIPIFGIHRDPQYFSNPDCFHPERFYAENKHRISQFTYLPFGTGPHSCIGTRLGLLQVKIGLVNFLRNHYVVTCSKTPATIKLNTKALVLQSSEGIYCNVVRDSCMK